MVPVRAGVKIDPKVVDRVKQRLECKAAAVQPHRVSVGIHESEGSPQKIDYEGHESPVSVVAVAAMHEFGERSWLRTWFDRNRSRLVHEMNALAKAEYQGDHDAIAKAADKWAAELREWIEMEDAHLKKLADSTVQRKQRAGLDRPGTPLFATGELVAAIAAYLDGHKQ